MPLLRILFQLAEQSVQPWTPVISDTSGPIPKQPIKQQAHKTNNAQPVSYQAGKHWIMTVNVLLLHSPFSSVARTSSSNSPFDKSDNPILFSPAGKATQLSFLCL